MSAALHEHLTYTLGAAYRQLRRSLEGLTPEQAAEGTVPGWKQFQFGVGLDGSIQGMVRHVAVWKHAAAVGLATGEFPEATTLRWPAEWPDLLVWLEEGQQALEELLAGMKASELLEPVSWEGEELTRSGVLTLVLEHDHYHAGQVNLLRQMRGHALAD